MNYLLSLSTLIVVLLSSSMGLSFSSNHIENMSGVHTGATSRQEARAVYKSIRRTSRGLRILNCPIKLIEMQYNGIESVLIGTKILQRYFDNNSMSMSQFQGLMTECENTLQAYERNARHSLIQSRTITPDESQALALLITQDMSPHQMALVGLVMNTINQDTVCYVQRTAVEIALGLGGSLGTISAECFTPMGRHFLLSGPSIGYGLGIMTAVTVPNTPLLPSAPNWQFKLYEQSATSPFFHEKHRSIQSGLLLGTAHEYKSSPLSPMRYRQDIKALVGWGGMIEKTHNFTYYTPLNSLFFSLHKVVDLNWLLNKIAQI